MSFSTIFLILALIGIFLVFTPQIVNAISTVTKSKKQKEEDLLKEEANQKRREDEGIFVTLGRIILGNKTLDDAIKAEEEAKKQKKLKKNLESTAKHLEQEFGKDKVNQELVEKVYGSGPYVTESEMLLVANTKEKKKRRGAGVG